MPVFVVVVILLIVGSQEKAPVPGKGVERSNNCHPNCHKYIQITTDKPGTVDRTGLLQCV